MAEARKTILIAEDDHLLRKTSASYLTGKGYHVLEARNGKEALERAAFRRTEEQHRASLEEEVESHIAMILQAKQEWERTVDAMPDMVAIVDRFGSSAGSPVGG